MNNSFQQCISDICGLEISSLTQGGKYTVFSNRVAVVEGHKGIVDYTAENVSFVFDKGILEVVGTQLKLSCLERHYSVITGKILSISVKNG